jgi:hypothetical protein
MKVAILMVDFYGFILNRRVFPFSSDIGEMS